MDQRTKDLWIIPVVVGVVTGMFTGAVCMVWGAWYTGVKLHAPFSISWFTTIFYARVALGVMIFPILLCAMLAGLYRRQALLRSAEQIRNASLLLERSSLESKIEQERTEHAAHLAALQSSEPRLHAVWNSSQTFWHKGRRGDQPMMQIGGWVTLTSSNTDETLYLLSAFVEGVLSKIRINVTVQPNVVQDCMVVAYIVPPLQEDETKEFVATIVVEDQKNRRYPLPRHTFRATPGPSPMPAPPTLNPPNTTLG